MVGVGERGVSVRGKKGKLIRVLINPHTRGSYCKKKKHKKKQRENTQTVNKLKLIQVLINPHARGSVILHEKKNTKKNKEKTHKW